MASLIFANGDQIPAAIRAQTHVQSIYFAHIKCALNAQQQPPSTPRNDPGTSAASEDVNDLLHFPMSEAFTDPLKLLHFEKLPLHDDETNEINHWSHPHHPLILNVEGSESNNTMPNINSSDPIKVCYACVRPLSFPYYSCKDGCAFTDLHKYCAHLPLTSAHQLHPDHTLHLVDTWKEYTFYKCIGCLSFGNTFAYKCETNCKFYLCVNCESLPTTIKHKSHNHPLIQVIDPLILCKACDKWSENMSFACKACDFQLDMYCAIRSPVSLSHRYCKGHEILLTYPPVENHPEDFYCDICEEEMDPSHRYVRFSPEVISSAQNAIRSLPLEDVVGDVLKGKWDHERTKFSLPPLMNLLLAEPGTGGSSTPSMVGAVKNWQKSDPQKSLDTWRQLSVANTTLEHQLNLLSKLAEDHWDTYIGVIYSCSMLQSEKWIEQASEAISLEIVKALQGARDAMLNIRCHMREMGKAAGIPVNSLLL
nr:C1-like protein [Tanacetum cinerariifolium]